MPIYGIKSPQGAITKRFAPFATTHIKCLNAVKIGQEENMAYSGKTQNKSVDPSVHAMLGGGVLYLKTAFSLVN